LANRIWEVGILGGGSSGGDGAGLMDHASGRFLEARRLSTLRGLWTDKPELSVERVAAFDVSELAAVVPFGLLPADDPRMRALAQGLLRNNVAGDEANMLTPWAPDPSRPPGGIPVPSGSQGAGPSSLATLWMARYLIRLGRETGEGRHWNRALALV